MNWAHVHLLINHIPVLGTLFGTLLLVFGIVKKNEEIKRVSLGIFVIIAVAALPVYLQVSLRKKSSNICRGWMSQFLRSMKNRH